MVKVRFSQRCAGGCGVLLRHGTRAVRAHRQNRCQSCHTAHRAVCRTCVAPASTKVPREALTLF